jgi:circadian clock protein KaiB
VTATPAIPTFVRRLTAPIRNIIGDLSDTDRVLVGLQPEGSEMMDERTTRSEEQPSADREATYALTLFVTGASERSGRAIANVHALCEEHLTGRYTLDVVDVLRDPSLMSAYDVVAAPTLIKERPSPKRMLVGDLSDTARVLLALDVRASVPAAGVGRA